MVGRRASVERNLAEIGTHDNNNNNNVINTDRNDYRNIIL